MSSAAALKAWETRRANAQAKSNAARQAWQTRRRKASHEKKEQLTMAKKAARSIVQSGISMVPTNAAGLQQLPLDELAKRIAAAIIGTSMAPAQSAVKAEVQGPTAESLHGQDIMAIAQALKDAEAAAAANTDGLGEEYALRAKQIRFVLWTRKYTV